MSDITELYFIEIALKTDDPFVYIMSLLGLNFNPKIYGKLANKCWNKVHPDKKLPAGKGNKKGGRQ